MEFILPSTSTIFPVIAAATQPQSIVDPPPYLTVGKVFLIEQTTCVDGRPTISLDFALNHQIWIYTHASKGIIKPANYLKYAEMSISVTNNPPPKKQDQQKCVCVGGGGERWGEDV